MTAGFSGPAAGRRRLRDWPGRTLPLLPATPPPGDSKRPEPGPGRRRRRRDGGLPALEELAERALPPLAEGGNAQGPRQGAARPIGQVEQSVDLGDAQLLPPPC